MPYHDIVMAPYIKPANPSTAGAYAVRAYDARMDGFQRFCDLAFADVDATAALNDAHNAAIAAIENDSVDAYQASSESFNRAAVVAQIAADAADAYAAIARERVITAKAAGGAALDRARHIANR